MDAFFDMVVAMDDERGIARQGKLPWHVPADIAHFRRLTSTARSSEQRNAVLMGRKTWDTLPPRSQPLRNRVNVVLSRSDLAVPEGVLRASSLTHAMELLGQFAHQIDRVFVIGGGEIYAQAITMPACRYLHVTRIRGAFGCDTFFPEFESRYELESVPSQGTDRGFDYRIEVWRNPHFHVGGSFP